MTSASNEEPFYHLLADVYALLFPVTEQQRRFFASLVEECGVRRVLDVACGTGEQAAMFRELGLEVSALENDERMLEAVRAKGLGIDARLGSMEHVATLFKPGSDMAICIGNSLPHLPKLAAARRTLDGMRSLLHPSGVLVVSIVNFDWVAREHVTALPRKEVRHADGRLITFERFYDLAALPGRVTFSTKLTIGDAAQTAQVPLTPISPDWLSGAVAELGMDVIGRYAGFDRSAFTDQSPSLILVAQRV